MDESLDEAIIHYVWSDGAAVPGHHPESVGEPVLLRRVEAIIADLDAVRPGENAEDLFPWSDREARAIATRHASLSEEAIAALRALLSWQWR